LCPYSSAVLIQLPFRSAGLLAGIQPLVRANPNGALIFTQDHLGATVEHIWLQEVVGVRPVLEHWRVGHHGDQEALFYKLFD